MRFLVSVVMLAILLVSSAQASPATTMPELRAATAFGGYSDVQVLETSWRRDAPAWTRASRLDLTLGAIDDSRRSQLFGTVAPVWSLTRPHPWLFAEFSIGPTVLGGSTVAGRELGGNFHFRSSLALGFVVGPRRTARLALRISHISNGGIRETNPGLDYIGMSFAIGGGVAGIPQSR